MTTYDFDAVEASMCVWEYLFDDTDDQGELAFFYGACDGGMPELRRLVIELGPDFHAAWEVAHADGEGFDDPFDWEFIPRLVQEIRRANVTFQEVDRDLLVAMGDDIRRMWQ